MALDIQQLAPGTHTVRFEIVTAPSADSGMVTQSSISFAKLEGGEDSGWEVDVDGPSLPLVRCMHEDIELATTCTRRARALASMDEDTEEGGASSRGASSRREGARSGAGKGGGHALGGRGDERRGDESLHCRIPDTRNGAAKCSTAHEGGSAEELQWCAKRRACMTYLAHRLHAVPVYVTQAELVLLGNVGGGSYFGEPIDVHLLSLFPRHPPRPLKGASCGVVASALHLRPLLLTKPLCYYLNLLLTKPLCH